MVTFTKILEGVLGPLSECLTEKDVQRLTSLPRDPAMDARVQDLAEKANEGLLTPDERRENETFIEASDFVAILLARARARLRHAA
jgi:hypothetical protein